MPTAAAAAPVRGVAKRGKRALAAAAAAQQQLQQQQQQYYQGRVLKMVVARVALGHQTQGTSGMRKPPDGFDSVNSGNAGVPGVNMRGSSWGVGRGGSRGKKQQQQQQQLYFCHVVFDNDVAYPEYVITLHP
jgi:hypothetical protein